VQIDGLIETIGYPAVFLLVMGECMGVPMPGETALLIAAAASGTGGMFKIEWVIVSAAGGAIVGDTIGYWIGWRGGRALILRLMKRFSIKPVHLEKAESFFARHGGMAVFFGRSVSYLRVLTALLAGVSRMQYSRFLMFNAMGGISWAIVFGLAGYFFGKNLGFIEERIHEIAWGFLVVVAIGIAVYFLKKRPKKP
jgi:membrane protein DedA with SNARE-associated domain